MRRPELLPTTFEGSIDKIVEEIGEVLQAIGKLRIFGHTATDPLTGITYDNMADLFSELSDLNKVTEHMYKLYYENHPDNEVIDTLSKSMT